MSYSTIVKRGCKCGCGMASTFGYGGWNYAHAPQLIADAKKSRNNKAKAAKNKRLAAKVKKLHSQESDNAVLLQFWFSLKMLTSPKVCENCNASLEHYNKNDWFGSQHHVVDKALCPSVATNEFNHLVLGKWCCHSQWHTSFLNASKMPVFERAKEKFQWFRYDIPPNEFRKINPYLLTEKLTNVS